MADDEDIGGGCVAIAEGGAEGRGNGCKKGELMREIS